MLKTKSPKNGNRIMLLLTFWLILVLLSLDLFYHGGIAISGLWSTVYIQFVAFVIPFVAYLVISKQKIGDILLLKYPGVKNLIFSILLGVAIVPLAWVGFEIGNLLNDFLFGSQYTIAMQQAAPSLWALVLVGGLIPSVAEEIWFRGVIFSYYQRHITIGKIAIITGLFFGLMHGIPQFIYTFIVGIIWAYTLYYTRSIWVPIISHFVANVLLHVTGFLMGSPSDSTYGYYFTEASVDYGANYTLVENLIFFGVLGIVSALIIFLCMRIFKKYHSLTLPWVDINVNEAAIVKSKIFTWELMAIFVIWIIVSLLSGFGIW